MAQPVSGEECLNAGGIAPTPLPQGSGRIWLACKPYGSALAFSSQPRQWLVRGGLLVSVAGLKDQCRYRIDATMSRAMQRAARRNASDKSVPVPRVTCDLGNVV